MSLLGHLKSFLYKITRNIHLQWYQLYEVSFCGPCPAEASTQPPDADGCSPLAEPRRQQQRQLTRALAGLLPTQPLTSFLLLQKLHFFLCISRERLKLAYIHNGLPKSERTIQCFPLGYGCWWPVLWYWELGDTLVTCVCVFGGGKEVCKTTSKFLFPKTFLFLKTY